MINLHNIYKSYQSGQTSVDALININLTIGKGEALCITGKSGSGKTTLLDIITTILTPTKGQYFFENNDTSGATEQELAQLRNASFGFVFQAYYLLDDLTVLDNICLPFLYSENKHIDFEAINQLLKDLDIEDLAARMPRQLSGGQKQRVAIARALVTNPSVIIADEPTGNLDQVTGAKILDVLLGYWRTGKTLILVTHDLDIAQQFPRTISLLDGKIIEKKNE